MKVLPSWTDEPFEGSLNELIEEALAFAKTTKFKTWKHPLFRLAPTLDPKAEHIHYYGAAYSKRHDAIVVFSDMLGGYTSDGRYIDGNYPGDTKPIILGKILEVSDKEFVRIGGQNLVTGTVWQQMITKSEWIEYTKEGSQ